MPKEIVLEQYHAMYDESGSLVDRKREGLIQVGWSRYPISQVQVATFARKPVSHETLWDGFYVDMGREEINSLIRYLRKARDQAFGRDE